jgi:hypothetical protein
MAIWRNWPMTTNGQPQHISARYAHACSGAYKHQSIRIGGITTDWLRTGIAGEDCRIWHGIPRYALTDCASSYLKVCKCAQTYWNNDTDICCEDREPGPF